MQPLVNYIEQNFGLSAHIRPFPAVDTNRLPLYLKGSYDFFGGSLEGSKLVWAKVKEAHTATPDQLVKQGRQLREIFHVPVVFIFDRLDPWQRKRFIRKKVGFVQVGKQLYIPELLMQLSDVLDKGQGAGEKRMHLTPPAQCAVLYHLQVGSLEGKTFQQIAGLLPYSAMTVTRVVKELSGHQLITIEEGKEKSLKFMLEGKALWLQALPLLTSPVKEYWYSDQPFSNEHCLLSGDTALASYTMLAEGRIKNYAIGKAVFRQLRTSGAFPELDKQYGNFRLEVWHYNPRVLSQSSVVDKLSLYLSIEHGEDERIITALEALLNSIQW